MHCSCKVYLNSRHFVYGRIVIVLFIYPKFLYVFLLHCFKLHSFNPILLFLFYFCFSCTVLSICVSNCFYFSIKYLIGKLYVCWELLNIIIFRLWPKTVSNQRLERYICVQEYCDVCVQLCLTTFCLFVKLVTTGGYRSYLYAWTSISFYISCTQMSYFHQVIRANCLHKTGREDTIQKL